MKKYLFLILSLCTILCMSIFAAPAPAGGADAMINALIVTPEGYATADDAVVAAARLHSLYNGGSLSESSDVKACYDYAYENDIIFEGM